MTSSNSLVALPVQPAGTPWPTEAWPLDLTAPMRDRVALNQLLDHAFAASAPADLGETHAFVAIQHGRIVAERYWQDFTADNTYPSWSMAKSITQALAGILVGRGLIDIHAPVDVPEWQAEDDPRRALTLDHLLRMSSGLAFAEDYVDAGVSDVIEMLFGKGQDDVAHFAAEFPLAHAPDTAWSYSSGTSNIVARCLARALGKTGDAFKQFMTDALFAPIGMRSPIPKFDAAGTFIGSSFCFCTARDFARFGLLYLRDGVWEGERILPEGWVDYARTPTPTPPDEPLGYGAHWWLGMAGPGSFSANGYQGQFTAIVPDRDLVIVRHGLSDLDQGLKVRDWIAEVTACF